MALTKHQKLARGIKSFNDSMDIFFKHTSTFVDALQFHFYETHWIIGRPLIAENTLRSMMFTHRRAMALLAENENLKKTCQTKPLIGCIFWPKLYPSSKVLKSKVGISEDDPWFIPWGVKINLPDKTLRDLEDALLEAILYCASPEEAPKWIDWFEKENKAGSPTNLLLSLIADEEMLHPLRENLKKPALPFFKKFEENLNYTKEFKLAYKVDPIPQETTSIEEAYKNVVQSLRNRDKRNLDAFRREWKARLENLIFEGINWPIEVKYAVFDELTPIKPPKPRFSKSRWGTGLALDRQTYASFIKYFIQLFLKGPTKNQAEGETAILLWLMIYIAQDPKHTISIKRLLTLTTENLQNRFLLIDGQEIELSLGLINILNEYLDDKDLKRQQKLFPNLTEYILKNLFRKASQELLPADSIEALPEAFLTFPHPLKHIRMLAKLRKHQQTNPIKIYHDPISRSTLKRQLFETCKVKIS